MKTPPSLLPDLETLRARLSAVLELGNGRSLRIVRRSLPRFMSTFPNEIVTCQGRGRRKQRVFAKHQAGQGHDSFRHRGNLDYEAKVYQRVLRRMENFRPKFWGAYHDSATGDTSLFLEYVYGSVRVSDLSWKQMARQPGAMAESARWIGQFHAAHQGRWRDLPLSFLRRYDPEYYQGWADRTFDFARLLLGRYPWLTRLRAAADEWIGLLRNGQPTVIHGEFYAKTVLIRDRRLFIVDWESAAIAPGEIDLAALTEGEGWPAACVQNCERAYLCARWPEGAPAGFKRTLDAARIYLHFRWLGERPDWTVCRKRLWRYHHLHAAAQRLGLI